MKTLILSVVLASLAGLISDANAYDPRPTNKMNQKSDLREDGKPNSWMDFWSRPQSIPASNIPAGASITTYTQYWLDWNVSLEKLNAIPEDAKERKTPEFRYVACRVYEKRVLLEIYSSLAGYHSEGWVRQQRAAINCLHEIDRERAKLLPKCSLKRIALWEEKLAVKEKPAPK